MPRDNFTKQTRDQLGESVGFNCVRPGCGKPKTALNPDGIFIGIGNGAHDSAAAPGGPRYNEQLTPEQRRALDNGAWLCPTCARLVDIDSVRFPEGTISDWQRKAADNRLKGMHMPSYPVGLDFKTACENAQQFLRICGEIYIDRWSHDMTWSSFSACKELIRCCTPLIATNPYCAQFPHMVNLQNGMIDAIRFILNEIRSSEYWFNDQDYKSYRLLRKTTCLPNAKELEANEGIEWSCTMVLCRMDDFLILN